MKRISSIAECFLFSVINGELFSSHINGSIKSNGQEVELLSNRGFQIWRNIISKVEMNTYYLYDSIKKNIITYNLPEALNYTLLDEGDFLITKIDKGKSYYSRFKEEQILFSIPANQFNRVFLNRNYVITKNADSNIYEIIALDEGMIRWTWDISEKHSYRAVGKVRKGHLRGDVLLWEDRFIMPVAGPIGGPSPMYALDKDTGEELWCIDRPESPDNVIYNNRIVATGRNAIREYDLMTGELVRNEPIDLSSIDRGLVSRGLIKDDKIFYYSSKGYNLVIIDYNTLEVLDTYHLEKTSPESWQIADMKVANGRIYIKEYMKRGGTVHVLEY